MSRSLDGHFESFGSGSILKFMSWILTESHLVLLRRAAAAGHVSAASAEEAAALEEMVENGLIGDGRLTEDGWWREIRLPDLDRGSD